MLVARRQRLRHEPDQSDHDEHVGCKSEHEGRGMVCQQVIEAGGELVDGFVVARPVLFRLAR